MYWSKLEANFHSHPKFRKLARRLEVEPVTARGHVATLWSWANHHAPDGDLSRFDADDIAYAAEWPGEPEVFVGALVAVGLLDETGDGVELHEWMERAEGYKRAESARNYRKRQSRVGEPTGPSDTRVDDASVTRERERNREEQRGEEQRGEERNTLSESSDSSPDAERIRQVFDHYRSHHPKRHKRPNSKMKEWRAIKARLSEGYTVEDLCLAVDGCQLSPWHQGENDRGQVYDSLELIMRDGSKVGKFMDLAKRTHHSLGERGRRNVRAAEEFIGGTSG